MLNVLLTSVGRRSYLVEYFRQALQGQGRVICINSHADAPGMHAADEAFVVPPVNDPSYLPTVVELCRRSRIGLVCPLHDLDVLVLGRGREDILQTGAIPVVPDPYWARTALDKFECGQLLARHGLETPWATVDLEEAIAAIEVGRLCWPLLVKPRMGFGSIGVHLCRTLEQLRWNYRLAGEEIAAHRASWPVEDSAAHHVLIQQFITGPEYCIDVVNDLSGRYTCHLMCHLEGMRAGESDMAATVDPLLAGDLPLKLAALTRHPGLWGVDVVERQGRMVVLDVNPRFTGDYPFHHLAGADIPAALLAWATGRQPDPQWLRSEIGVRGFKDLVPTKADRRFCPT